ncbi:nucleotidyl transferase AbiEii/AbiGii toxin family protein [Actinomyces trachealis]|uniref:nucleotidyl transferase AbiEii/AbiGii toxin family protein n=1 Tax=Actinomyces trachealis TaxID=2763540 RepID=UPI001892B75C|nr:nucleotidyl transferase AbiEii/AbiGii toxin family protein [Actinomyces trachealis]
MADTLGDEQRRLTQLALEALGADGFALAGSGAIREHGLINRPTQDIDLFTVHDAQDKFTTAFDRLVGHLREHGYVVEIGRTFSGFAALMVTSPTGVSIGVDMGVDWREQAPVQLEVGPVLALEDAVGNKVAALFSRGEVRDYLDVDAIRCSGRYTDAQLYELGVRADAGFTLDYFALRLDQAQQLTPEHVADYEVSTEQLAHVRQRMAAWAVQIRQSAGTSIDIDPTALRAAQTGRLAMPPATTSHDTVPPVEQDDDSGLSAQVTQNHGRRSTLGV